MDPISFNYPLVLYTQLDSTDLDVILDLCTSTIGKHGDNNEECCKIIKETLDKTYKPGWNIVIGSNYASEVTYESKFILYFYFGLKKACLIWKCN